MTKAKLFEEVSTLLNEYEPKFKSKSSFEQFKSKIEELVKPKSGGGVVQNPSIEKDGVIYHFCRYTNYYLPESEIVMSKGKSKGYSRKAIAKWNKMGRDAKVLDEVAMKLLLDKKFEEGTSKSNEASELRNDRNKTSMYDDVRKEYESIKLDVE